MDGCAPWVHNAQATWTDAHLECTVYTQWAYSTLWLYQVAQEHQKYWQGHFTKEFTVPYWCRMLYWGCWEGECTARVHAHGQFVHTMISFIHSFIHTWMHIYVIATCKTQLQHCKLDCLLVSVCGNFFQYQFLLEPCISQYDKAVGSHCCPKYLTPKHTLGMHGLAS